LGLAEEDLEALDGPPSPLKTMTVGLAVGGIICKGTTRGERIAGSKGGVHGGNQKSTLFPHN